VAGPTGAFLTVLVSVFLAELTDKDALLLLALATKTRPLYVFAAGSVAFTITTAIIVSVGAALVALVPISWIKLAGGTIMLAYAVWNLVKGLKEDGALRNREERLAKGWRSSTVTGFLIVIASLAVLDLAGDATELLTIVFVAQFKDILLVASAAVVALVAATGVETILGNRLGRILTPRSLRYFSVGIFLLLGTVIIATTLFG
jgi:putative Ca2+/H+ antiporter (TMEM165/GDT1 family)